MTYNTASNLIKERISLLVKNGISGLIIVLIVLFVFLAWKTAIWVALGIPIAFLATFGVMFFWSVNKYDFIIWINNGFRYSS